MVLKRDVDAVQIPSGVPTVLPEGTEVQITQTLGGTFTVIAPGCMARIGEKDADALGMEIKPKQAPTAADLGPVSNDDLWTAMKNCYDPEIPVNIVDLGLVYDCVAEPIEGGGNRILVKMTLTAPGCGMGGVIAGDVENRLREVPGVSDVHVEVVWDPIWNQSMMSDAARLQLGLM